MKYLPAHIRNINGITPTEEVPFVSSAERDARLWGFNHIVPAQLAVADTVQLRVMPMDENDLPRMTIRESKQLTDFSYWFLTLGRAAKIQIDASTMDNLECTRYSDYTFLPKPHIGRMFSWYDKDVTRSTPRSRATVEIDAIGVMPEYDNQMVRVIARAAMLSAPNSPVEKSGALRFNMAYLEELK